MPLPLAANIVKVVITFTDTNGNEAFNVQHFKRDDGVSSAAQVSALLTVISNWLTSDWTLVATNQWSATRIEGLYLGADPGFYVDLGLSITGAGTSNGMPADDTIAISLRTGLAGRSFRGRLYHVGLGEGDQDGGFINPTSKAALIDVYDALKDDTETAGWDWGVLSYYADSVQRVTPLFTKYFSVIITDDIVDSMKTRKQRA